MKGGTPEWIRLSSEIRMLEEAWRVQERQQGDDILRLQHARLASTRPFTPVLLA
jgi:hypothetical protein